MNSEKIYIEINDQDKRLHRSTVEQFLADNTDQGECQIDSSEIIELHNLKVGQTMKVTGFVGHFVTVRRISHDMKPVAMLNELTHFSRDGKTCLCGKPVIAYRGPSTLMVCEFYHKAFSTPSCRTCREAMTVEDYHVKAETTSV